MKSRLFGQEEPYPGLEHVSSVAGQFFTTLSHQRSPRILGWVAFPFSRRSSQLRNRTRVSCIADGFFTSWATMEAPVELRELKNNQCKERFHLNSIPFSTYGQIFLKEHNCHKSHPWHFTKQGKLALTGEETGNPCHAQTHFVTSYPRFSSVQLLSHVQLFVIPWTTAHQTSLSMKFFRPEYWGG